MVAPTPAVGLLRLHVYGPDLVSRGTLAGIGASGTHSKSWGDSSLTFTANALETDLAADPNLLDDAFVVVELDVGGVWTPVGTPYLLSPGEGTVLGPSEGSAWEHTPTCVGALRGLLDELVVLPKEVDDTSPTLRYACGIEGAHYMGWQSRGYTEDSSWHDVDIYTPTETQAKYGEPGGWDDAANTAEWVFRDAAEGGLTLFRIGNFTLTVRTLVKFISSADEEHKVYLDGPNMGGVIIDSTANETGYTDKNVWKKRLEPGTYRVSAEMTTVDSVGGDGNDSFRFACGTVTNKGRIDTVLLETDGTTRVRRQSKDDLRPGMSLGETIRRLLEECSTLGLTAADILLDNRTFTDTTDSAGQPWDDGQEWVWPLGTSLASAFADFDDVADMDIDASFGFNVWNDRGTTPGVTLEPGADPAAADMDIVEYGWVSDPAGPTRMLTLSQDGFDLVTHTTVEAGAARPRVGFLEVGAAASIARARLFARAQIEQTARPRHYYRGRVIAVTGAIPFVDFEVCDVVTGRNYENAATPLECVTIGFAQPPDTDAQTVQFPLELTLPEEG